MAYVYQEFPRWLYKAGGDRLLVDTEAAKAAALADGWQVQPVADAPVPISVPRRGRPPKVRPQE